eukprot:scaffold296811_cov20-Prasinocladus_malaysianus.AAC.1
MDSAGLFRPADLLISAVFLQDLLRPGQEIAFDDDLQLGSSGPGVEARARHPRTWEARQRSDPMTARLPRPGLNPRPMGHKAPALSG